MYVQQTARSLGDMLPTAASQKDCARRWKQYKAQNPQGKHNWRNFAALNPACHRSASGGPVRVMPTTTAPATLGTILACGDVYPGGGTLADCWRAAEQKGLAGLGAHITQDQLSKLSTAYQRITRPNRLAGLGVWSFNGRKMVWRNLGDPINEIPNSDIAPNPFDASLYPAMPSVPSLPPMSSAEVMPDVSAQTLWAAAQLPGAPPVVTQAASQLTPAQVSQLSSYGVSWWQQSAIAGIPNYLLVGLGVVAFLSMAGNGRRR